MKTPMQEVFAHLRASKETDGFGEVYCVDWLLENEKSLLEKEKEMIMDAVEYGISDWGSWKDAEQYYNKTFKPIKR